MKIKLLIKIISCSFVFLNSPLIRACLPKHAFNDIQLKEMFHDEILNNVRKSSSYFSFSDCGLVCVVNTLNSANIKYTISGSLITYKTDQFGLSTMVVDDPKARTLSGYLTCNANGNWQYIKIPIVLGRSQVVMDFQSTDALKTSRSISLMNVSRSDYLRQMSVLERQSSGVQSFKGYKTVNLKNGHEVFILDSELSKGKMTYVFVQ